MNKINKLTEADKEELIIAKALLENMMQNLLNNHTMNYRNENDKS